MSNNQELFNLWTSFTERWPLSSLRTMSLEDYNSIGSKDSFCYWLESKTEALGSIWGGSAFKFGIFEYNQAQENEEELTHNRLKDDRYKWLKKYGATAEEAFGTIRDIIVAIAEASATGELERIDEIDLGETTKWKIAFLYQNRDQIKIPAVYLRIWLCAYIGQVEKKLPNSKLYEEVMKRNTEALDIFDFSSSIWKHVQASYVRSWVIAPGEDACFLEEFVAEKKIKIGWSEVGDLSQYADKTALFDSVKHEFDYTETSPKSVAGMLWDFCHEMKEGDIVYLKKGMSKIVGRGVVTTDYSYENNGEYKHIRDVEWTHIGKTWNVPFKFPVKTLSKVSADKCSALEKMLENDGILEDSDTNNASLSIAEKGARNYWWLNANPKIWSMASTPVGTEQDYTLYNDKQHKRRIFQYFLDAQVGDILVGYESTPVKQIVALFEISKAQDGERICFKKIEHLTSPIDLTALQAQSELAEMEFFKNSQASLLKLTAAEYDCILDLIRDANPIEPQAKKERYTKADFLSEVFMASERYDALVQMLRLKKNVILQGAPGVGKTFAAKRLAYAMMGEKDNSRIEMVQFHQNYAYEDFVMGYKPEGATFVLKQGVFYRFCKRAMNDPERDYFFIIDEINRGNMSKIFGELLMLIEKDYRETAMTLAYSDVPFSVPKNVHLVGMMNTADRSLAMIDYALRRRFSFFDITPGFDSEGFRAYQQEIGSARLDAVVEVVKRLNREIAEDKSLGKGFCIGHSYLCDVKDGAEDVLRNVVTFDILPMLAEYWFDELDKYERWAMELMDVFK